MSPVDVDLLVSRALDGGRFFVARPGRLRIETVAAESLRWEIYLGHLLDPAFARTTVTFAAWHVFLDRNEFATTPLISIRWQADGQVLHVTRQILTHAFEAFEDAPGVILTRPTQKWVTELVGSIAIDGVPEREIEQQLSQLLLLAMIGTSRLPITSLESPLPDFSLGHIGYRPFASESKTNTSDPITWLAVALADNHSRTLQAKALETTLRTVDREQLAPLVQCLKSAAARSDRGNAWTCRLLRDVFNGAALSPYTQFSDTLVTFVERLAENSWFGSQAALATLSYMLRHLCRHLTAFDLTLFHNFGANYPDALFLDSLLKAYLTLLTAQPELATAPGGRLLRRALRQACLARKLYEGHRVPDSPTSMGENTRVLPAPFNRVPDEQIYESGKRTRRLFSDELTDRMLNDITRGALQMSLDELDDLSELQELGMAIYLDRPLGALKQPGEVDRTPLVSYEAYSRFVAARRLATLKSARWIDHDRLESLRTVLASVAVAGIPVADISSPERPGVVSLTDANKAASDFVVIRSTRSSLYALLEKYDWQPLSAEYSTTLDWLLDGVQVLLVHDISDKTAGTPVLRAFAGTTMRLELGFPREQNGRDAYREAAGLESVRRLQVLRVTGENGTLEDLSNSSIWIEARNPSDLATIGS